MVTSVQKREQVKRAAVFNCVLQNTDLNKGHGFLTFKKVEIIEKADARAHTTLLLNGNSIRAIFFRRKV